MTKGIVELVCLLFAFLVLVATAILVAHVADLILGNEFARALISALFGVWTVVKVFGLKLVKV